MHSQANRPDNILRRPEVEKKTGLRRSAIYEAIAAKRFPRPIPLAGNAVGWLESEILEWQRSRIAQREAA